MFFLLKKQLNVSIFMMLKCLGEMFTEYYTRSINFYFNYGFWDL